MVSAASYLDELRSLANAELTAQVTSLLRDERRSCARVIAHLAEISRRQAHVELGFTGLFDYCVNGLGFSEGAAGTRVHVARAAHRVPVLLEAVSTGKLSLTVAGRLAPHLTAANCVRVIDECAGMTKRRAEEYIVRWKQKPRVSSGIRRRPERGAATPHAAGSGVKACGTATESVGSTAELVGSMTKSDAEDSATAVAAGGGGAELELSFETGGCRVADTDAAAESTREAVDAPTRGQVEPCAPEVYNVRFAVDGVFKEKLERLAEVLGVHRVEAELAAVLERALDLALDKKDPERRRQRREERKARKDAREKAPETKEASETDRPCPDKVAPECGEGDAVRTRHVPVEVRDDVLSRAGHRCEFVSAGGRRCTARVALTLDHVQTFASDGSHDRSNLRAFCGPHNQLYAKECFGSEFIERKIEERRRRDSVNSGHGPTTVRSRSNDDEIRAQEAPAGQLSTLGGERPRPDKVSGPPRGPSSRPA